MTAATLSKDFTFTPGFHFGSVSAVHHGTTNFGFKTLKGVVLTTSDNNDVIVGCSISSGDGTITIVDDGGAIVNSATKIFYQAWGNL